MPKKDYCLKLLFVIAINLIVIYGKSQLPNYIPVLSGGKYGFCDSAMNLLIEPKYDFARFHQSPDYYSVEQAGNTFLLHKFSGQWIYNTDSFNRRLSGKKYSLVYKNDTLLIYDNQRDVIISSLYYKTKRQHFLHYTVNQNTPVFLVTESKNPLHLLWLALSPYKIKSHFIISPKGILYKSKTIEPEFNNGYFKEKHNGKFALFKATPDTVIRLTGHEYYYIGFPNAFGNSSALKDYDIAAGNNEAMDSSQLEFIKRCCGGNYKRTHIIDSAGNEILSLNSGGFPMPTFENNALLFDTSSRGYKGIIFKDTLTGKWPSQDSIDACSFNRSCAELTRKSGTNYLIKKNSKLNLVNNSGRKVLPNDYSYLTFFNDSTLLFIDSSSVGVVSASGKEFLNIKVAKTSNASIINPFYNYIWTWADRIARSFIWTGDSIIEIDSTTNANARYNYYQKAQDSLRRIGDMFSSLSNKKIFTGYNYESKTYNVYCDSALIIPHMEITKVNPHYDVLFVMKDKQNHTWIYDNKGKVVYNTNEEYEYDVRYSPSGNVNHYIITIRNSKHKFVAAIHWPGFNGQPNYSTLPIKRFIDSFTVVSSLDYENKEGLLDKNHNLIIWPNDIIEYKKSVNVSSPNYLFFSNGFIYDQTGKILLDEVFYEWNNADLNQLRYYPNNKILTVFIDKYNNIYKIGITK